MPQSVVHPDYRPYVARVIDAQRLSPHFVRIVFGSEDFRWFGLGGLDQRIKVVFPLDGAFADFGQHEAAGDWYDRWRNLPHQQRNPFRTYTVRRIDPAAGQLTVDFVLHEEAGPAGAWAQTAAISDELVIVGPDERGEHPRLGIDWHPGAARRCLLAGDETAASAICAILESIDPRCHVDAFIEVPTADDALTTSLPTHVRLRWLPRGHAAHGAPLIDAVSAWADAHGELLDRARAPRPQRLDDIDVDAELLWDAPTDADGEFYAWMAGEAATIKTLRRLLVAGHGVDRRRVAFMGYWRAGQAERTE